MGCVNIPIETFEGTTWIAYMDISGYYLWECVCPRIVSSLVDLKDFLL